jgi:hypothetical protein
MIIETITLIGRIIKHDHNIYITKEGILIPLALAIEFINMFGAFPMYVIAPITTELTEIATKMFGYTCINSCALPPAILKNKRYDGALSRKEEAREQSQKYTNAQLSWLPVSAIYLCIVSEFSFSINRTGAITKNIVKNVIATSLKAVKSIFILFFLENLMDTAHIMSNIIFFTNMPEIV